MSVFKWTWLETWQLYYKIISTFSTFLGFFQILRILGSVCQAKDKEDCEHIRMKILFAYIFIV